MRRSIFFLSLFLLAPNLAGARVTLRAVYKPDSPFNMPGPGNDTTRPQGMLVDLLNLVAQQITAEGYLDNNTVAVQWHQVADGRYGGLTPSGTWNGLPGEIVNGTADVIASYFNVDELRQSVVLYSTPYFSNGFVVITRIETSAPDPFYFVRPFLPRLWFSIFAVALLSALLLYFVDRVSPFGFKQQFPDQTELRRSFNFSNTLHAILYPLLGQSALRAQAWSSKFVYLGFLFMMLITMSLFTANLTAYAVVKRFDDGIQSVWDLQQTQAPWCLAKDSEVDLWFSQNSDPRFRSMLNYAVFTQSDESECIALLRSGAVQAVVTSLQIAEYQISLPPCSLQIVGRPFTQGYSAFAVSTANATLQRALSRATQHFVQTGVVDSLYRAAINGPGSCNDGSTSSGDISSSGMDVTSVSGVFYVCFGFFAVGLLQLGIELLLTKTVKGDSRFQRRLLRCCGWQRSLNGDDDDGDGGDRPANASADEGDDSSTDDGGDLKPSTKIKMTTMSTRRLLLLPSRQASTVLDWSSNKQGMAALAGAKDASRKRLLSETNNAAAAAASAADDDSLYQQPAELPLYPPRKGSAAPNWAAVSAFARETSLGQMLLPSALLPHHHSSYVPLHRGSHAEGGSSSSSAGPRVSVTAGVPGAPSVQLRTLNSSSSSAASATATAGAMTGEKGGGGAASGYYPPVPPA